MKKIILLLLFIVPFLGISQVQLSGKVMDSLSSIEYANVVLKRQDGTIVTGAITTEDGSFTINDITTGTYLVNISFIGYEDWDKEIVMDKNLVLDDVVLNASTNNLDEVVLTRKKKLIERKIDRLVFNVENSIAASGGNALEALKIAPGIAVEDDQIALIGRSAMRVMIEGRIVQLSGEELVGFLNSISASDIKKIEIITNPPAKYEAAGNSGLINIIYKKGARNSWSNTTTLTYQQADLPIYILRNSFFYNKDKVKLSLNLNGGLGNIAAIERANIFYSSGPWNIVVDRKDKENFLSGGVTFDYELGENSTIGIQYLGNNRTPDVSDRSVTTIFNNAQTIDSLLINNGLSKKDVVNHSLNAHFVSKLDTLGRSISFDIDYFNYDSKQNREFRTDSFLENNQSLGVNIDAINDTNQSVDNYSAKVDIEHPLDIFNLSYGAKVSFLKNNSNNDFFNTITGTPVLDLGLTNEFEYTEDTQAVYVNASKKFSEKWDAQFGLRLENTNTEGISATLSQTNKNHFLNLFPTVYFSYIHNDNNSFSLNYGRRISRPNFFNLNPFRFFINSNTSSVGNPFLQPSFTDNVDFTHTYKGKFTTNLFFSAETNGAGVVPTVNDETNEQIITRENFFTHYNFGISESYVFDKISWWESYTSVFFLGSESVLKNVDARVQNGFRFFVSTNNSFSLNKSKTIKAELNSWYSSRFKRNLNDVSETFKLDAALRFSLLENNLQLSVGVNDIFRTSIRTMTSEVNGITQTFSEDASNRFFRFSAVFKTGNKKINVRKRRFGNEEEKRRTN
jgi:hypothetical protein